MKKCVCLIFIAALLLLLVGCSNSGSYDCRHLFYSDVISPTCTQGGYTRYTCIHCKIFIDEEFVPALQEGGHTFDSYVCTECDFFLVDEAADTEYLTYLKISDENGDEAYAVTGIAATDVKYIKIPSAHDGLHVTQIADNAFDNILDLKYVIIPEGVVSIGDAAFRYCFNLKSIAIPESVILIGERAFWDCQRLECVSAANISAINYGEFLGCESLTAFEIPDGVISIEIAAFESCTALKSVTIPASVQAIYHAAFRRCENLSDIYDGTKAQWNAVSKEVGRYINTDTDASWDAYTGQYTVHCSDGDIAKVARNWQ